MQNVKYSLADSSG